MLFYFNPSLENIFKELQADIEGFKHPGHGMLIGWAEQGNICSQITFICIFTLPVKALCVTGVFGGFF